MFPGTTFIEVVRYFMDDNSMAVKILLITKNGPYLNESPVLETSMMLLTISCHIIYRGKKLILHGDFIKCIDLTGRNKMTKA